MTVKITSFRIWITCTSLSQREEQLGHSSRRLHTLGDRQNDLQTCSLRNDSSRVHLKQKMLRKCEILRQPQTRPKRHHCFFTHPTEILQRTDYNHGRRSWLHLLLHQRWKFLSLQRHKIPKKTNQRRFFRWTISLLQHHASIHHKSRRRCSLPRSRSWHSQQNHGWQHLRSNLQKLHSMVLLKKSNPDPTNKINPIRTHRLNENQLI